MIAQFGSEARVVSQQTLDLGAEFGLAAAMGIQEGAAFLARQISRSREQHPHALAMGLIHSFSRRFHVADTIRSLIEACPHPAAARAMPAHTANRASRC